MQGGLRGNPVKAALATGIAAAQVENPSQKLTLQPQDDVALGLLSLKLWTIK